MSKTLSDIEKESIRISLLKSGALRVGFAAAGWISDMAAKQYSDWIAGSNHAGMEYLKRHVPLRQNTDNVLENAKTIICLAFSYVPHQWRAPHLPMIASYAVGDDYHDVIRKKLKDAIEPLKQKYGGEWRICIDSAPVAERYWAQQSGIGICGINGAVIVPGYGSLCFLAEILTTIKIPADTVAQGRCKQCGKCIRKCPTGALKGDGTVDAGRCLSYLTIEHKGEWNESQSAIISNSEVPKTLFGCDICLKVCPHNSGVPPSDMAEFRPRAVMLELDADTLAASSPEDISNILKGSPLKRAGMDGLIRNANKCISK